MKKPARSIFVHGIYLGLVALILIFVPNFLLSVLGMPETGEIWIRVMGMLVLILAFYFIQSARKNLEYFFGLTVVARLAFFAFLLAVFVAGMSGPAILIFGALDFLGAFWTIAAFRAEQRKKIGFSGTGK